MPYSEMAAKSQGIEKTEEFIILCRNVAFSVQMFMVLAQKSCIIHEPALSLLSMLLSFS